MPPRRENPTLEDTMAALVDKLDQILLATTTSINQNAANHDSLSAQLSQQTEITAKLVAAFSQAGSPPPPPPPPPPSPPPPPNNHLRPPKIHLPTFDGSNPLDWIFQAENYFTYYAVPFAQRLSLAVFYFTGDALSWYKYLANNNLLGTWAEFTRALELRFGPSSFENHQATLFKLKQTTTVAAYQTDFEKISNCVIGLSPESLLNCFLSGLRSDIQNEIAIHHPTSLHQAYGLSKLIEDKLRAQLPSFDGSLEPPPTNPPLLPAPSPPSLPLPVKRLSPADMQKRRAEGLCYNCPAKYQPGHQCNPPKFLLLQSETDPPWTSIARTDLGLEDKAIFQDGSIDTSMLPL